jgi:selenocysteine-specific elongation factor
VLEPDAPRLRRKDAAALARLERLRSPDPLERLAAALEAIGLSEWTEAELIRRTAIAVDDLAPALARLHERGRLIDVAIGSRRATRVSAGAIEALEQRILTTLRRLHAASPRLASIPRPRLITALADLDHDGLVQALIDRLAARGAIAGDGKRISIRGHEPKLSKSERRLLAEIGDAYKGTRFTPPDVETWSKRPGTDAAMVGEIFSLLRDEDLLRHLGGGLHLEAEAATELHELVIARLSDGSTMTMADLRDLLGTSRKYAVPIGEYLDRAGLTVREGDVRRLAKPAPDPQPEGARS